VSPRPRVHGEPLWGRTAYPEETGYFFSAGFAGAAAGAAFFAALSVAGAAFFDFFSAGAAFFAALSAAGAAFFSAAGAASFLAGAAFAALSAANANPATENANATAIITANIFFISFPLQREYLDA